MPTNVRVDFTSAVTYVENQQPENANYVNSPQSYLIRWNDNANDESGYQLQVRLGNTGSFTPIQNLGPNTNSALWAWYHLAPGTVLQFVVVAFKLNGSLVETVNSAITEFIIPNAAANFETPTNLTATNASDGVIKLTWTDNSSNEIRQEVFYRKQGAATWNYLGYVEFNVAEVQFQTGFLPGTTWEFKIRATRMPEGSANYRTPNTNPTYPQTTVDSAVATVTTPALTAPSDLVGKVVDEGTIELSWKDNSFNETGYQVEWKRAGDADFSVLGTVNPNQTSVSIPVGTGQTISWRVKAIYAGTGITTVTSAAAFIPNQANPQAGVDDFVTTTTVFKAPTSFAATTSAKSGAIDFTWQDNSAAETNYEIWAKRKDAPEGTALVKFFSMPPNTTTATITGRDSGTVDMFGAPVIVPFDLDMPYEFEVRARYQTYDVNVAVSSNGAEATPKDGFTSRFYEPISLNTPFSYQLETSGDRIDWSVSGLPAGLQFNQADGMISGTPTVAGLFVCPITATYLVNSSPDRVVNATLTLRIIRPVAAPSVATAISNTTIGINDPFSIPLADKFSDPESESAVRFETTVGQLDILLFPSLTPETVANFMAYVNGGGYNGVAFHRSVPGFVIQGGGYVPTGEPNIFRSLTDLPSPRNEPGISNVRGTITFAKQGNNQHSATNEFFFNLADNSGNLDDQNGGFAAFGRIAGGGMAVADAIAALPRGSYNVVLDGDTQVFSDWPLHGTAAPAAMDVTKAVRVTAAYPIAPLTYTVTANSNAAVVTPTIVDGALKLVGLTEGNSTVTVRVRDLDGSTNTQTFTVTVTNKYKAPVITKQPLPAAVDPTGNATATFTVAATGTALTYQWRHDGVNIPDAIGSTLKIPGVQAGNLGEYEVLVGNATTTLTSNKVRLDFKAAPAITAHPQSKYVMVGQPLVLEAAATGAPAPTLSWLRNGAAVAGQTKPKLSITAAKLTDGGAYAAKATNSVNKATSNVANVCVIDGGTRTLSFVEGATAVLTAGASGPGITFQWRKDGVNLPVDDGRMTGTQAAKLTIRKLDIDDDAGDPIDGPDSGLYTCRITLPNGLGTIDTGATTVAVVAKPVLENFTAPTGTIGYAYEYTLPSSGDLMHTITSYSITGLPQGLSYVAATGKISGRPTRPGTYTLKVTARNAAGASTTVTGTLSILPLPMTAVGTFIGYIDASVALNGNKGGRLDLTIADTGSFTAKLLLGAESYSAAGPMVYFPGALVPQGQVVINRKGKTPILLSFTIEATYGNVSGTISDSAVGANLLGFRQFWHSVYSPYWQSGIYNVGMKLQAGSVSNQSIPQGASYTTININTGGVATFSGRMADNTSFTCSSPVSIFGEMIMFQMLNKNTGSILGLQALGNTDLDSTDNRKFRVSGSVRWIRGAQGLTERNYRGGFGPVVLNSLGITYKSPVLVTNPDGSKTFESIMNLPDAANNTRLVFSEGGLAAAAIDPNLIFKINAQNVPELPGAGSASNPGKVKLSIAMATGGFSGSFELTDPPGSNVKRTVTFQGLIIPQIPATPANAQAGVAEIPGSFPSADGYFLLNQLPSAGPPATTLSTSPLLSGLVSLQPTPLVITNQPVAPAAKNPGESVSFNVVVASGQGTYTYQWRRNGVNVAANGNGATYTIASVTEGDQASYDVVISNGATSITSQAVALSVNDPASNAVAVIVSPADGIIALGANVTLSVSASGTAPFTYQWRKGGQAIPGATSVQYTITGATAGDAGTYDVLVSNPAGQGASTDSNDIVINPGAPVTNVSIGSSPTMETLQSGQTLTFTASAQGTGPFTYQWRKNGSDITDATSSSYQIQNVSSADDGDYTVLVSSPYDTGVVSNTITVNLSRPVSNVVAQCLPSNNVLVGTEVTFSVTHSGSGPFTYQWRKGSEPIAGATSSTYQFNATLESSGSYNVTVGNSFTSGEASNTVTLNVSEP